MNEKEVAEIRRRYRQGKSSVSHIVGCYVNEKREIVARFDQSLTLSGQEESEKFLALLRRTLSGQLGKNLIDISFSTAQVAGNEGDEHALLMALRDSALEDEPAREEFFARAIETIDLEGNYLILLTCDRYDVPYYAKDGQRQDDAGSEVYTSILCSICPVKMTKPALSYFVYENEFHNREADWLVAAPEMGFLFPAFTDRGADLYGHCTTPGTPPTATPASPTGSSMPRSPCPPPHRRKPSRQSWRNPWVKTAAARWCRPCRSSSAA